MTQQPSPQHLKETSVKISNFKCFNNSEHGFDSIESINLIIGKNNSGKSNLLDMTQLLADKAQGIQQIDRNLWRGSHEPSFLIAAPMPESQLRKAFPEHVRGGGIPGTNHWEYGKIS